MNNVEKTVLVILAAALIAVSVVAVYGFVANSTVYSNYGPYGSTAQGVTGNNGGNSPQSGTYGPNGNSAPYNNNYGPSGYGTYGNPGPYTNNAPWGAYGGFGGGMMGGRGMMGGVW